VLILTPPLTASLNAGDNLYRLFAVIAVDRVVVLVIRVGSVTPGRIPPAVIPAPPAPVEKDESNAMVPPPPTVVMMMAMIGVVQSRLPDGIDVTVPIAQAGGWLRVQSGFCCGGGGRKWLVSLI